MPVPAVPRRAGPPRKKSAKGTVTPQPAQVVGEEGELKESPAGTPSLHAANAPAAVDTVAEVADVLGGAEKEVPQEEREEHADDITGEAEGNKETDDSQLAYMASETPEQDAPEPPTTDDHKHVHAEAVVEAYGTPASISVVAAPSSAPIEQEHSEESHEEGEVGPSEAQAEVAPTDDVHAGTEEAVPEVAQEVEKGDEDEEDDPATRRKRVAERLAKMGAVNPFAARVQSSDDSKPERKDSVGSAASPTSPVSQRRKASAMSVESSPIAGTQHQVSPPSSPVVRKSQGSRKASTMSVEAPRESPRRPSVDPAPAIIHEPSHASPSAEEPQEYSEEPARQTYEQDDGEY
jgi:myosin tail region-interacting protein MTI1